MEPYPNLEQGNSGLAPPSDFDYSVYEKIETEEYDDDKYYGIPKEVIDALFYDHPYDIFSILKELTYATGILLNKENYDHDGWERTKYANDRAKELIKMIKEKEDI